MITPSFAAIAFVTLFTYTISSLGQNPPPDQDGCIARAEAEAVSASKVIRSPLKSVTGVQRGRYEDLSSSEQAALDKITTRTAKKKLDCVKLTEAWNQARANAVSAQLEKQKAHNVAAILEMQHRDASQVALLLNPARSQGKGAEKWGYVAYLWSGDEPIRVAGGSYEADSPNMNPGLPMKAYVSDVVDLSAIHNSPDVEERIRYCSSLYRNVSEKKLAAIRFDYAVRQWHFAVLKQQLGIVPRWWGCGNLIASEDYGKIVTICEDTSDPTCTMHTKEDVEKNRRWVIDTQPGIEVHAH